MRAVLVGMNNPLSLAEGHELYPHPSGCSGWRLWQLLRRRVPQVSRRDFLAAFERHNLVRGPWSADLARRRARDLRLLWRGRTVVVLGEAVRGAFDLPRELILPVRRDDVVWRQLPHPSGRNLWFNDETCAELAALLLEELYHEATL